MQTSAEQVGKGVPGLRVQSPLPSRYPAYRIVSEAGELLATVPITASGDSGKLAHVMAAAPDMAAFVNFIANFSEPGVDLDNDVAVLQSLIRSARLLRSKAEGAQ